ncbi:hypothetical protein RCL_jg9321.t1 [Rhizophagus clarus]|uniref:Uncharacterized protein n=1 Tax=Rhizophagus clarus TaxID=94130 RepID=A0A8H3MA62_9GLOM|nr:hypothetical protein RCL_jg9321.t1 [Rhizophagus clarus]
MINAIYKKKFIYETAVSDNTDYDNRCHSLASLILTSSLRINERFINLVNIGISILSFFRSWDQFRLPKLIE